MLRKKKRNSTQKIQLTALVDVFTMLIVFFMLQYSADPELIKPKDKINLPVAQNSYATHDKNNINVLINDKFIKINESEVLKLSSGEINKSNLHAQDSEFIASLHGLLESDEKLKEGKDQQWVILADERVPYETIKKTIYTLAVSGYTKIKLASTAEFR